jgi:hypothetical protein
LVGGAVVAVCNPADDQGDGQPAAELPPETCRA